MGKVKIGDVEFYINKDLRANLDIMKDAVSRDWDFVLLIDGMEGSGKSVLGMQVGKYLDPSLNLDRIVFSPKDFKKAVTNAKKQQCVIFDEAFGGFASRRSMTWVNITLVDMMAEIRQKNLFILIVMPTFFDMDKNIALWRSRALVHVYVTGKFQRGKFKFYNNKQKKLLYLKGRKLYNYNVVKASLRGEFANDYAINEAEYRIKKMEALRSLKDEEIKEKVMMQRDAIIYYSNKEYDIPVKKFKEWTKKEGFELGIKRIYQIISP